MACILRREDRAWVVADERPAAAILGVAAKLLEAEGAVVVGDDVDAAVDGIVVQAHDRT